MSILRQLVEVTRAIPGAFQQWLDELPDRITASQHQPTDIAEDTEYGRLWCIRCKVDWPCPEYPE